MSERAHPASRRYFEELQIRADDARKGDVLRLGDGRWCVVLEHEDLGDGWIRLDFDGFENGVPVNRTQPATFLFDVRLETYR